MAHQPERTCIGCRGTFPKDAVVRIVAGPAGVLADYREKLPGRGAYVCPSRPCISAAFSRDALKRALRSAVALPPVEEFIASVARQCEEKLRSLIRMAAKAGMLAVGASAVRDSLDKGRSLLLIFARDLSSGTREDVLRHPATAGLREVVLFSRDDLGRMLGRELAGVLTVEDKGFADAVWSEAERLKRLLITSQ